MNTAIINRKRVHAECGGEIEIIVVRESFRDVVQCKKCGEQEKRPKEEKDN